MGELRTEVGGVPSKMRIPGQTPPGDDLTPDSFDSLSWELEHCEGSLNVLYRLAQGQAVEAIKWYQGHHKPKRTAARMLRGGALLFATIAGVIPIVSEVLRFRNAPFLFSPAWASVSLVLAAALITLDRFFGCSTGWMRYALIEAHLQRKLRIFQMDWELANANRKLVPGEGNHVTRMVGLARRFTAEIQNLIVRETDTWRNEFLGALKQLDTSANIEPSPDEDGKPAPSRVPSTKSHDAGPPEIAKSQSGFRSTSGEEDTDAGSSPLPH